MNFTNRFFYALMISIGFLIIHMLIAYFKLSDNLTLILTMIFMVAAQVFAFLLFKNNFRGRPIHFMDIFLMLGLTMGISVILLALNSAFNPFAEHKPLNISEIFISLFIFAGLFPIITTAVIWILFIRRR